MSAENTTVASVRWPGHACSAGRRHSLLSAIRPRTARLRGASTGAAAAATPRKKLRSVKGLANPANRLARICLVRSYHLSGLTSERRRCRRLRLTRSDATDGSTPADEPATRPCRPDHSAPSPREIERPISAASTHRKRWNTDGARSGPLSPPSRADGSRRRRQEDAWPRCRCVVRFRQVAAIPRAETCAFDLAVEAQRQLIFGFDGPIRRQRVIRTALRAFRRKKEANIGK